MEDQYFLLKEEHIKLIQRMHVGWQDCEFGAPEIDPKRPYGNSDVYEDISEIINIIPENADSSFSKEQLDYMEKIHKETRIALQIIVKFQSFEPGEYIKKKYHYEWEKLN